MNLRTCNRCGWVHCGVTRAYAEDAVARFNAYFDAAEQNVKDMFGNTHARIDDYEKCFHCGGTYTDMRKARPGDCPDGCTLQPVITEEA